METMETNHLRELALVYEARRTDAEELKAQLADANKAAELLGKAYGIYTDKVEADVDMTLEIKVDYGDE